MQKLPSGTSLFIKNKEPELKELDQEEPIKEENFGYLRNSRRNYNKRGKQGSGRKWQRRASGSKRDTGKQSARENNSLSLHLKQQNQRTNGQGSGRGRRTVRKRAERRTAKNTVAHMANAVKLKAANSASIRDLDEEWRTEKFRVMQMVNPPDSNSAEEESDDNAQGEGYEQGIWELDYNGASNGWNGEPMEATDEDEDDDAYEEDDNGIEQLGEEDDSDVDLGISDASDEAANKSRNDDVSDSEDYSD